MHTLVAKILRKLIDAERFGPKMLTEYQNVHILNLKIRQLNNFRQGQKVIRLAPQREKVNRELLQATARLVSLVVAFVLLLLVADLHSNHRFI
jgi:hypothetical protein